VHLRPAARQIEGPAAQEPARSGTTTSRR
jgi:hypothetical protein